MPSEARLSDLLSERHPPVASSLRQVTCPLSAPGVILGLLFLSMTATSKCLGKYHELLLQLRRQADLMQDTSTLLDPYVSDRPLGASESQRTVGLGQQ